VLNQEQPIVTDEELRKKFYIPVNIDPEIVGAGISILESVRTAIKVGVVVLEEQKSNLGDVWNAHSVGQKQLDHWYQDLEKRTVFLTDLKILKVASGKWITLSEEEKLAQLRLVNDIEFLINATITLDNVINSFTRDFPTLYKDPKEHDMIIKRDYNIDIINAKLAKLVRPSIPARYMLFNQAVKAREFGEEIWTADELVKTFKIYFVEKTK